MKFFFCDWTGEHIIPRCFLNEDIRGYFLNLGLPKKVLNNLIKDKNENIMNRFEYQKLEDAEIASDRVYLSDRFAPLMEDGESIVDGFPHRYLYRDFNSIDFNLKESDPEKFQESLKAKACWELVDSQHLVAQEYFKDNPDVLIGILEVISVGAPSLVRDLFRCKLVGINYIHLPGNEEIDEANYFLARHLLFLRPGDKVEFVPSVMHEGEKVYIENAHLSYGQVMVALANYKE